MKRTKEDPEQTRQDFLLTSIRTFSRKGHTATKLVDIAHETGVARSAIYHHFGSKKNLQEERIDLYVQMFNDIIQSKRSLLNKIRILLSRLIKKGCDGNGSYQSNRVYQRTGIFADH